MENDLSDAGKLLLKNMGGATAMVRATPGAMARWGMDRPESIVHQLPPEVSQLLLGIPEDLLDMDEDDLLVEASPTRVDRRMRIAFWDEYESAAAHKRKMSLDSVATLAGCPSWQGYEALLRNRPALLAWVVTPPANYKLQMKEAESLGLERLLEILALPLKSKSGVVNERIALLLLQAYKLVDQRVRGAITQRNVNVNVTADAGKVPAGAELSLEQVEKRLKELETETLGQTLSPGPPQLPSRGTASSLSQADSAGSGDRITDAELAEEPNGFASS